MDQRGGVDQLDDDREGVVLVAEGLRRAGREEEDGGAEPLPAELGEVLDEARDDRQVARERRGEAALHLLHVSVDRGQDLGQVHAHLYRKSVEW